MVIDTIVVARNSNNPLNARARAFECHIIIILTIILCECNTKNIFPLPVGESASKKTAFNEWRREKEKDKTFFFPFCSTLAPNGEYRRTKTAAKTTTR